MLHPFAIVCGSNTALFHVGKKSTESFIQVFGSVLRLKRVAGSKDWDPNSNFVPPKDSPFFTTTCIPSYVIRRHIIYNN